MFRWHEASLMPGGPAVGSRWEVFTFSAGWETGARPLANASENLAGRVENRPGWVEFCIGYTRHYTVRASAKRFKFPSLLWHPKWVLSHFRRWRYYSFSSEGIICITNFKWQLHPWCAHMKTHFVELIVKFSLPCDEFWVTMISMIDPSAADKGLPSRQMRPITRPGDPTWPPKSSVGRPYSI